MLRALRLDLFLFCVVYWLSGSLDFLNESFVNRVEFRGSVGLIGGGISATKEAII